MATGEVLEQLCEGERQALLDLLIESPQLVEAHIRDGGTWVEFVALWKQHRAEEARTLGVPDVDAERVLGLPVPRWDERLTVGDYLRSLLEQVFLGSAGPKYGMSGGSDWRYDLYEPLLRAGLIGPWREGYGVGYRQDGSEHQEDLDRANALVCAAIRRLGAGGQEVSGGRS